MSIQQMICQLDLIYSQREIQTETERQRETRRGREKLDPLLNEEYLERNLHLYGLK